MEKDRDRKIEELFHAALKRPPPERAAFIETACAGDPRLREEVVSLLGAHEEDEQFLEEPAWSLLIQPPGSGRESGTPVPEQGLPFERLGEFQLIRRLGEGGMGVVYLARQESLGREVALKVIRPDRMGSFEAQARFNREVEAITGLRHPNIVTVYGSGRDKGVSYFAMERVPGKALGDLLREAIAKNERVPLPRLLEWTRDIARALESAHKTGIIHRDVKPSNIFITPEERAMLMDFGVARLVKLNTITLTGEFRGTPHYASPEQIRAKRQRITASSDVYSLGVTLYEAVTGRVPFEGETTEQIFHKILAEEPVPPRRLNHAISRDLETVILKAMEKDPGRRYRSMGVFAEDLDRLTRGEMILAKPAGFATRAWKRAAKHPVLSTAAVVASVCAVSFVLYLLLWSIPRLKAERDDVRRINAFLQETLSSADPWSESRVVEMSELLDRAAGRIEEAIPGRPEVRLSLRETLGRAYMSLGRYRDAEKQFRAALEILKRLLGEEHVDTLDAKTRLANALQEQGRWSEAESIHREVLTLKRRTLGEDHWSTLVSLSNLAVALKNLGRFDEAETVQREALDGRRRVLGPEHPDTLQSMGNLAVVYKNQGRLEEAEALHRKVVEIEERIFGPQHRETLNSMHNLANVLLKRHEYAEAEMIHRRVLSIRREILGDEHPDTLSSMNGLALALKNQEKLEEAEDLFRKTLAAQRNVLGEGHDHTLATMTNLANLLQKRGKFAEAESLLRESLDISLQVLGEDHRGVLITLDNLASTLMLQRKMETAETFFKRGIDISLRNLPRERLNLARFRAHYGECLFHMKRFPEAEVVLLESLEGYGKALGEDHQNTRYVRNTLSRVYKAWGKE